MAPIDIIQAQAEVAINEQQVIVAEASIKLERRIGCGRFIFDPDTARFLERDARTDRCAAVSVKQAIDVDAAVRNALDKRTDSGVQAKNGLQQNDVAIRYFHNEISPDVNESVAGLNSGRPRHPGGRPSQTGRPLRRFANGQISDADHRRLIAASESTARRSLGDSAGPELDTPLCRSVTRWAPARRTRTWRAPGCSTSRPRRN